jgi:hypothetical protein
VTHFNRFVSYYVRSALPFLSGIAFGIFLIRWDHPLWIQVLAGLTLVVVGPFAIRLVLTLVVEALRGVPDHNEARRGTSDYVDTDRGFSERQDFRQAIQDKPRERHRPTVIGNVQPRPMASPFSRNR